MKNLIFTGMGLDIAIIVIMALFCLVGAKRGVGRGLIKLICLICSVVLGVTLTNKLSEILVLSPLYTGIYNKALLSLEERKDSIIINLPEILRGNAERVGGEANNMIATKYAESVITIFSFVIIVVACLLISLILQLLYKKGKKDVALLGGVDSFFGFIIGAIKGIIIICVIVAGIFPILMVISPESIEDLYKALQESRLTLFIYDNNPLLMFLNH